MCCVDVNWVQLFRFIARRRDFVSLIHILGVPKKGECDYPLTEVDWLDSLVH
jgi:hypothetical protein